MYSEEERKEYSKKYRATHKEYFALKDKEYRKNNAEVKKKHASVYYRTIKGRYNNIKNTAGRKNKSFLISMREFEEIISLPCHYCNDEMGFLNQTGSNLDRLDCDIGYELNNIVSCCKFCNTIKSNILTPKETKVAVEAILNVRRKNKLIICD